MERELSWDSDRVMRTKVEDTDVLDIFLWHENLYCHEAGLMNLAVAQQAGGTCAAGQRVLLLS